MRLELHIAAALEQGLSTTEVEAALKMAEYVQERPAGMTADKASHVLEKKAERRFSPLGGAK